MCDPNSLTKPEDYVRCRIMETLQAPATKRIDFRVGALHVDASGFAAVQFAVFSHAIGVSVEKLTVPNANAIYHRGRDTFLVGRFTFGKFADEKAALLHECVHAMTDIQMVLWTYGEDEATGYIAEMLFYRYHTGSSATADVKAAGLSLTSYEAEADRIAGLIANTPGALVSPQDVRTLASLVLADPAYSGITLQDPSGANGVAGLEDD